MECRLCGKQLLSKPDKPIEGGIKIIYQEGMYYPVCNLCADFKDEYTTKCDLEIKIEKGE